MALPLELRESGLDLEDLGRLEEAALEKKAEGICHELG
jgi:hypothetical protein